MTEFECRILQRLDSLEKSNDVKSVSAMQEADFLIDYINKIDEFIQTENELGIEVMLTVGGVVPPKSRALPILKELRHYMIFKIFMDKPEVFKILKEEIEL